MRMPIIVAALAAATATAAFAQADTRSHNPALKNPTVHTTAVAATRNEIDRDRSTYASTETRY